MGQESVMMEGAKKILVAEDNVALSSVVRFNLQRAGFAVTTAENGQVALERARGEQFDLIITDQQMPHMTGIEFCRSVRELENYDHVPIIMLTGKALELELPRLREELRICATFPKPFSPSKVVTTVRECLAREGAGV